MSEDDRTDDATTALGCPSESSILSFVDGSADPSVRARIEAHIGRCEVCRQLVSALAPTSGPRGDDERASGALASGRVTDVARAGTVLAGKYRVVRVLGQGGMGVVLEAHHETLDRPVALKFLQKSLADNQEAVARFFREARAAAALDSEHVVRVLDAGHLPETNEPYLALEFLAGRDLASVLREDGPLPVMDAVDYVLHAAEALSLAHARGIVHRDIKPANLFLTRRADGSPLVKVLDFGVAKILEGKPEAFGQTSESAVLGSPRYMAPEQLQSSTSVDARADVWALGVSLYELLTGRAPFEGTTVAMLCAAILTAQPPSVDSVREGVPAALADVVARCLAKDPGARIEGMDALARALSPFASAEGRRVAARAERLSKRPPATEGARAPRSASALVGGQSTLSSVATSSSSSPPPSAKHAGGARSWVAGAAVASVAALALAGWVLRDGSRASDPASSSTSVVDASAAARSEPAVTPAPTPAPPARSADDARAGPGASARTGDATASTAPPATAGPLATTEPPVAPPKAGKPITSAAPVSPAPSPSLDPLHRDGLLDRK